MGGFEIGGKSERRQEPVEPMVGDPDGGDGLAFGLGLQIGLRGRLHVASIACWRARGTGRLAACSRVAIWVAE
jgi:hypothetical protein